MRELARCLVLLLATTASAQNTGVTLLRRMPAQGRLSGVWGHETPDGRELAIVGEEPSLWLVDVTDPVNAVTVGRFAAPTSRWREVTSLGNHVYAVSEHHAGLRIVDVSNPAAPVDLGYRHQGLWSNAHTISIDPDRGHLYVNGTNVGMLVLDAAANPTNPPEIGRFTLAYVHDATVRRGRAYLSEINAGRLRILDVGNLGLINQPAATLARFATPSNFTHSSWVSRDDRLLITADEVNSSFLKAWDISVPAVPVPLGGYQTPGFIVHNVLLIGRTGYIAHNAEGFHMVDLADPNAIARVARYDTSAFGANAGFEGAWGVYPFADSGVVYASDRAEGLYLLQVEVGHFNRYGRPTRGGSRTPRLEPEGATPRVGAASLQLRVEGLAPNAPFALLLSAASGTGTVFGVDLHVDLGQVLVVTSSAGANGAALLPLPVPANPGLANQRIYLQVIAADPAGPQGLTASRGTWFGIAP
jgi:choice-of-anchor B domain-containing protein